MEDFGGLVITRKKRLMNTDGNKSGDGNKLKVRIKILKELLVK